MKRKHDGEAASPTQVTILRDCSARETSANRKLGDFVGIIKINQTAIKLSLTADSQSGVRLFGVTRQGRANYVRLRTPIL